MTMIDAFRQEIEAFLAASQTTATALGKGALGDPNFVFDLRKGRVPNLEVVDRVKKFIAASGWQSKSFDMVKGEAA